MLEMSELKLFIFAFNQPLARVLSFEQYFALHIVALMLKLQQTVCDSTLLLDSLTPKKSQQNHQFIVMCKYFCSHNQKPTNIKLPIMFHPTISTCFNEVSSHGCGASGRPRRTSRAQRLRGPGSSAAQGLWPLRLRSMSGLFQSLHGGR